MGLTSKPVIYGNEVLGLGHLVCINILAYAAIHQYNSKEPHIVICDKNSFDGMRQIIEILSHNICFVPVCVNKYHEIIMRKKSSLYSFEYFCRTDLLENGSKPLYGAQWNKGLEYLGNRGIRIYNENFLRVPRLSELYPGIFQRDDKIAVVNARTTPTDTYSRNSDPAKLQPVINLLRRKGYRIVRLGGNFSSVTLDGIDLDVSNKWSSGIELSALRSAYIVIGSLTGITILSGMLSVPTVVYDCPTPIQTYLFHNFPNHYILFKRPPVYAGNNLFNIYEYFGSAEHEYMMLGSVGNDNSKVQLNNRVFGELMPNTAGELCVAVEYVLDSVEADSIKESNEVRRFKDRIYERTGLTSSHNRLFPESIYRR